jgi:hypothetical protein
MNNTSRGATVIRQFRSRFQKPHMSVSVHQSRALCFVRPAGRLDVRPAACSLSRLGGGQQRLCYPAPEDMTGGSRDSRGGRGSRRRRHAGEISQVSHAIEEACVFRMRGADAIARSPSVEAGTTAEGYVPGVVQASLQVRRGIEESTCLDARRLMPSSLMMWWMQQRRRVLHDLEPLAVGAHQGDHLALLVHNLSSMIHAAVAAAMVLARSCV